MRQVRQILENLRKENRLRSIPIPGSDSLIDLSGNDYLGLAASSESFLKEFSQFCPHPQFSSSASRLLSQRQECHLALEEYLQSLYGKSALLYNSGYHANVGTIGALAGLPGTLFVADKLIHASIIDGLKICGAEFKRFPHNDISRLISILEKESPLHDQVVLIVESIYSMDGDEAPINDMVALKSRFPNVLLYVDEAHAFGVRGERGLGLCEELGILPKIDILIGTLGKAAASSGAFVICDEIIKSLLINISRPFIFSTALPPVNVAWSHLMIKKIVEANNLRLRLHSLSHRFKSIIEEETGIIICSTSQIIPFMTGDASTAIEMASQLREENILALPIRRPTVPPGGERIRFSLSAVLTINQIEKAAIAVSNVYHGLKLETPDINKHSTKS